MVKNIVVPSHIDTILKSCRQLHPRTSYFSFNVIIIMFVLLGHFVYDVIGIFAKCFGKYTHLMV